MIIIKFLLLFNREALGQVFSRKENLSQEGEGRMKNERFVEHLDYLNTASLSRVMICNAAKKQFWGKKDNKCNGGGGGGRQSCFFIHFFFLPHLFFF